jgi:hypothetical protein
MKKKCASKSVLIGLFTAPAVFACLLGLGIPARARLAFLREDAASKSLQRTITFAERVAYHDPEALITSGIDCITSQSNNTRTPFWSHRRGRRGAAEVMPVRLRPAGAGTTARRFAQRRKPEPTGLEPATYRRGDRATTCVGPIRFWRARSGRIDVERIWRCLNLPETPRRSKLHRSITTWQHLPK